MVSVRIKVMVRKPVSDMERVMVKTVGDEKPYPLTKRASLP
jgi:hypothetical protein